MVSLHFFMRLLLALPVLVLFAAPVNAQAVYLKCTRFINHVDKGPNTPDNVWLTINPGQQYGNARFLQRSGAEQNFQASQFISSSAYTLTALDDWGSGISQKYRFSVNRSTGSFTHAVTIQSPYSEDSTITTSGTCKKDVPAKTLF